MMNNTPTTKTITITHGNGSTQTMEVPFDFDESKIKPITSEQIEASVAESQAKDAQKYLDDTDWYVVRKLDTGVDIPAQVTAKRQECRDVISAYRAANP